MTTQATGMPSRITRHPVDVERAKKRASYLAEDMADAVAAARRNLVHCNALRMDALDHAAQLLVLNPESRDVYRSLRLSAEAVVAIFAGAMVTTDQVEVRLGESSPLMAPSAVTPDLHDVGNWTDGFFMAAICRDSALLDVLCRVPMNILRGSTTRGLEDSYLFAEALQSYRTRGGDANSWALAAFEAAKSGGVPAPVVKATRELATPAILLFLRLLGKEADPFNEALASALELHRRFWSRSENFARDPRGYFSLPLTGLSALAHDAGIPVNVESDYLPMMLVRGDGKPSA